MPARERHYDKALLDFSTLLHLYNARNIYKGVQYRKSELSI